MTDKTMNEKNTPESTDLYVLLALDRTRNECVWWAPNRCGYTPNLNDAGRYTEEEARSLVGRDGDPVMVPLDRAMGLSRERRTVEFTATTLVRLRHGSFDHTPRCTTGGCHD